MIGRVAIGKARHLLNVVLLHLDVQLISLPYIYILKLFIVKHKNYYNFQRSRSH